MTTRERQLLALCEEMIAHFDNIWQAKSEWKTAIDACFYARERYGKRLDRLTKRKGKK